nr:FKBP-type peptidyl-prolyl cis-trans isomerase [Phytoactinopolyspora alkaliphila]
MLAACGDGDGNGDGTSTSSDGVDVSGSFGEKPTVAIPDDEPSSELEVEVLSEGDGSEVGADDFVIAHYLGQTWEPRDPADIPEQPPAAGDEETEEEETEDGDGPVPYVFDNSYDRGAVSGFSLNRVIEGWKEGLAGQKVGSRVLLSIPPAMGYGVPEGEEAPEGQEPHDLSEDTLVFIVDIVESVAPDAAASGTVVDDLPDGLPSVEGTDSGAPTVEFGDAEAPDESDTTILVRGEGAELADNVVVHLMEVPYDQPDAMQSTWDMGMPEQIPVEGLASLPGWDGVSEELTVGSRILTRISGPDSVPEGSEEGAEERPLVLVVDILATY